MLLPIRRTDGKIKIMFIYIPLEIAAVDTLSHGVCNILILDPRRLPFILSINRISLTRSNPRLCTVLRRVDKRTERCMYLKVPPGARCRLSLSSDSAHLPGPREDSRNCYQLAWNKSSPVK